MLTIQVTLTDDEGELLRSLSQCTGKTDDELIREALGLLKGHKAQCEVPDRLALLRQARGIWRDRNDLPTLSELRDEMNRDFSGN
jgi:hypothetical protein